MTYVTTCRTSQQLAFLRRTTLDKRASTISSSSTCSVPVSRICSTCAAANSASRRHVRLRNRWCACYAQIETRLHCADTWGAFSLRTILDHSDTNDPREESDLQRHQTGQFPHRSTGYKNCQPDSRHRLWHGEAISRPALEAAHPVSGTQEFERDGSLYEYQYASWTRSVLP